MFQYIDAPISDDETIEELDEDDDQEWVPQDDDWTEYEDLVNDKGNLSCKMYVVLLKQIHGTPKTHFFSHKRCYNFSIILVRCLGLIAFLETHKIYIDNCTTLLVLLAQFPNTDQRLQYNVHFQFRFTKQF